MREFAKIPPHFWINGMGYRMKDFSSDTKTTVFYLLTNPHAHMLGIYYLPIAFIALETEHNALRADLFYASLN